MTCNYARYLFQEHSVNKRDRCGSCAVLCLLRFDNLRQFLFYLIRAFHMKHSILQLTWLLKVHNCSTDQLYRRSKHSQKFFRGANFINVGTPDYIYLTSYQTHSWIERLVSSRPRDVNLSVTRSWICLMFPEHSIKNKLFSHALFAAI